MGTLRMKVSCTFFIMPPEIALPEMVLPPKIALPPKSPKRAEKVSEPRLEHIIDEMDLDLSK